MADALPTPPPSHRQRNHPVDSAALKRLRRGKKCHNPELEVEGADHIDTVSQLRAAIIAEERHLQELLLFRERRLALASTLADAKRGLSSLTLSAGDACVQYGEINSIHPSINTTARLRSLEDISIAAHAGRPSETDPMAAAEQSVTASVSVVDTPETEVPRWLAEMDAPIATNLFSMTDPELIADITHALALFNDSVQVQLAESASSDGESAYSDDFEEDETHV